jgi:hypothetical protein
MESNKSSSDPYYNHIIETLVENLGISKSQLYIKSGIESKWQFVREINNLLAKGRITQEYGIYEYSPKVLFLVEKIEDNVERILRINYLPMEVLRKELNYLNNGSEPEDCPEYELEIAGYQIKRDQKYFFEQNNNISLSFDEFTYFLWEVYLHPGNESYFKSWGSTIH